MRSLLKLILRRWVGCRQTKWSEWLRLKKSKWARSSMKWGRTSCRSKAPTRCLKVWSTDRRPWWTNRLGCLSITRDKLESSSIIWCRKGKLDQTPQETSNKMRLMRTVGWCWRWYSPLISNWMKWSFYMKIPRVALVTLATKSMSLRKSSRCNRSPWLVVDLPDLTLLFPERWTQRQWKGS